MISIIQAAGWPIYPLLLCSIVALAIILERIVSLRAVKVTPPPVVDEVLNLVRIALPGTDTTDKLAQSSVMGLVLAGGIRAAASSDGSESSVRAGFEAAGRNAVHQLERYLNTLGSIATAAPLLGLLGTVVGMIELFGVQSPTGANPEALAHGISIALYNTAFGLIIAVPSLMFHRYFRGRVNEITLELERGADRLLPELLRQSGAARR